MGDETQINQDTTVLATTGLSEGATAAAAFVDFQETIALVMEQLSNAEGENPEGEEETFEQRVKVAMESLLTMSRTAQCLDAAPIESFWGTLKTECATYRFNSHQQARTEIFSYVMGFYNRKRLHSALDYKSPHQYEQQTVRLSHCL